MPVERLTIEAPSLGLNTFDFAQALDPRQSPDLLNMDLRYGGKALTRSGKEKLGVALSTDGSTFPDIKFIYEGTWDNGTTDKFCRAGTAWWIYHSTAKTGTATSTSASHLVDSTAPFTARDVGRKVTNTTDSTTAYITAYNSTSDVTVSSDIFISGEAYSVGVGWGVLDGSRTDGADGQCVLTNDTLYMVDGGSARKCDSSYTVSNWETLLDGMDAVTGWTPNLTNAVFLNNTTYTQGTGSVSLAKVNATSATLSMSKDFDGGDSNPAPFNMVGQTLHIKIYPVDLAEYNTLAFEIRLYSSATDYIGKFLHIENCTASTWNDLYINSTNYDTSSGTVNLTLINKITLVVTTAATSTTIAQNNLLIDKISVAFSSAQASRTILNACDATTGWTVVTVGGTISLNYSNRKEGVAAIDFVHANTGSFVLYRTVPSVDLSSQYTCMLLYIATGQTVSAVSLSIGDGATDKTYGFTSFVAGWNVLSTAWASTVSGSTDTTAITALQLNVIRPLSALPAGSISMDVWYYTDTYKDQGVNYNTDTAEADPFKPNYISEHENRLYTLQASNGYLRWTAVWNATLGYDNFVDTDDAGYYKATSGDNDLAIGLASQKSGLLIFTKKSITKIFGADPNFATFNKLQHKTGCIAPKSIVSADNRAFFLSKNKGNNTVRCIDDSGAMYDLSDDIQPVLKDSALYSANIDECASVVHNDKYIMTFYLTADTFKTVALNCKTGAWELHQGSDCLCYHTNDTTLIGGHVSGQAYTLDTGTNDDSSPITSYFKTKPHIVGFPERTKKLKELHIWCKASGDWALTLNAYADGVEFLKLPTMQLGTIGALVTTRHETIPLNQEIQGLDFQLKFGISAVDTNFEFYRAELIYELGEPTDR